MASWVTESIILQIIITAGVVMGAGLPAYFAFKAKLAEISKGTQAVAKDAKAAASDAKEARIQVKNSHTTNLREEGDERHEATMAALKELGRDVRGLRESSYATRQDIGLLHAEDRVTRRETQELRREFSAHIEQTAPMMPTLERLVQQSHPPE